MDLSNELRNIYAIEYIPGHITTDKNEQIPSIMEWTEYTMEDFYDKVKKNPDAFKTSAPTVGELEAAFEKHILNGEGVFFSCMSSKMSCSFDNACVAAENIRKKYSDASIRLVDSRRFGAGSGLLLIIASELRKAGRCLDDVADYIESIKFKVHQAGWHDDLQFCAKKGRISNSKAFFGTLVGIKPIGDFSRDGLTTVLTKVKGEKTAYSVLLDYIGETIENPEEQIIIVSSTNRTRAAMKYIEMIKERFHPAHIYYTDVFMTCGAGSGPGLMAAYYVGKEVSEGLVKETEIFARLTEK